MDHATEIGDCKPQNAYKMFCLQGLKIMINHRNIHDHVFTASYDLSPNKAHHYILYNLFLQCHSKEALSITPESWLQDFPLITINLINLLPDCLTHTQNGFLELSTFCNLDLELQFEAPLTDDFFYFLFLHMKVCSAVIRKVSL